MSSTSTTVAAVGFLELLGVRPAPALTAAAVPAPTHPAAVAGGATAQPLLQIGSPWSLPGQLEQVVMADVFGAGSSTVTRAQAMAVPAIARARHLVCGVIAGLDLAAYRADVELPADQAPAWIARTDSALPAFHRMVWTVDDVLFTGYSLWRRTNGSDGYPLHCDRIARDRWTFDPAGRIEVDGELVTTGRGGAVQLIVGPHEGILNMSPQSIRHAANVQRAADRAAETPSAHVELHQESGDPLGDEAIAKLKADWIAARLGANGGVAYTNQGITVKEHGTFEAHLLADGRNAAAVDQARNIGVPASMVDAVLQGSSLTYSTIRDRAKEFVDYGVGLYMRAVSGCLSTDGFAPAGLRIAFDLEEWLPTEGLAVADSSPAPTPPAAAPAPTPEVAP